MSARTTCALCENKDANGIFKCEGCAQIFCLKHTNEHRNFLDHQLAEIILKHKNLSSENNQQSSLLSDQINRWEKESILKIKQTAQDLRVQTQRLVDLQKLQTKEKFDQFTKQLDHARENHTYLEKDLYRWKILLEQFRYDLTNISPSIALHQDQTQAFVKNISISEVNVTTILTDTLVSDSNSIQFDDHHHIAMHCGPHRTAAYVKGTEEYASGRHYLRLFLSKKTNEFTLSFNIMSATSSQSELVTYGWQSDDCINPSQYCSSNEPYFRDLKGRTKFHIALVIDCDQTRISYFNEKTQRKREIDVDVKKCPLPWKLYFYLYDVGDCVRLLSSSEI